MKVLEIKNNLVKISYDINDNVALSSFVIIEDSNMPYVGQVVNLKADTGINFAIVKLLFTFNEEGILKNYNGTIPSSNAQISTLPSNELLDIIPAENPINFGELAQQNVKLKIDKSIFESNFLVCSNNLENTTVLLDNFIKQIEDKIVIFDIDGEFDWEKKIYFGKDFKLPLNYDTINFIYDNDLEDVDATSKAIIQDIFLEVQEYARTLPEKFIPFENFLTVVDEQYKTTQITQLVLLKNKLLKYKEQNVFAENLKEILDLSIALEKNDVVVIDISDLNDKLQNEVISYTYDVMSLMKETIYAFTKVTSANADKKLLKKLTARENILTTIICSHDFKYLSDLKQIAQNMLFFAPLTMQHDFASYNTFLNKLNNDEFIIYGSHTQNIPLIVQLAEINGDIDILEDENNNIKNSFEEEINEVPSENKSFDTVENFSENEITNDFEQDTIELIDNEPQTNEDLSSEPEIIDADSEEFPLDISEDNNSNELSFEEPVEETIAEPIEIIDESEQNVEIPNILEDEPILIQDENNDDLVEQVARDVDKVFYEKLPTEDEELENNEINIVEDELTENDLNMIDDLNFDVINENEESVLPDFAEEEQPPVVPIYPADDLPAAETDLVFEPGDRVSTPKYGEGVVEKMIKYGNKSLCSINFPEIGRRLLDPAMSEITKL